MSEQMTSTIADEAITQSVREHYAAAARRAAGGKAVWSGCVSGALDVSTYMGLLADAGFAAIALELTQHPRTPEGAASGSARVASAFVRATKPLVAVEQAAVGPAPSSSCCGSAGGVLLRLIMQRRSRSTTEAARAAHRDAERAPPNRQLRASCDAVQPIAVELGSARQARMNGAKALLQASGTSPSQSAAAAGAAAATTWRGREGDSAHRQRCR